MHAYMSCSIDRNGSVALLCSYLAGGGAHVAVRPRDDVGIAPTTGALYTPTQTDKQTNRQTDKQTPVAYEISSFVLKASPLF